MKAESPLVNTISITQVTQNYKSQKKIPSHPTARAMFAISFVSQDGNGKKRADLVRQVVSWVFSAGSCTGGSSMCAKGSD
jgi:hypothetical protein